MNESELTRNIVKALNLYPGVLAVKIHGGPHQRRGLPDIVGCARGFFFGIEMKMPGKEGNVTSIQRATLRSIRDSGGITGVATSLTEARTIIDNGLLERGADGRKRSKGT